MKLHKKVFKTSTIIFLTSILILFIVSNNILLKKATKLENYELLETANCMLSFIDREIKTMSSINFEYSKWDETYKFMENANKNYIKSNFSDTYNFKREHICFFAFISNKGKVIYSGTPYKSLDISYNSSININNEIVSKISSLDLSKSITGILVINAIPFLVNCHPVIGPTSNLSRGAFLLVKPLKSTNLENLHKNLKLDTKSLAPIKFDYKIQNNIFINIKNRHTLEEYVILKDIFGKSAVSINLYINRNVYTTVQNGVYMYMAIILIVIFSSTCLYFIFLNRIILRRIINMRNMLIKIKNTKNFSLRIKDSLKNEDEITELNKDFNSLLQVLENSQTQLLHMAYSDPLTKIPNRKKILKILNALSKDTSKKFALFYMDLNDFKGINDKFGHQCGDFVLTEVSTILKNIIDENCIVGRLGGDEFVIIKKNIFSLDDVEILAKEICLSLQKPIKFNNHNIYSGISIGISIYPDDTKHIPTLLEYSDLSMYVAKSQKRNSYKIYSKS